MGRDRVVQLQECAEELGFSTITEASDAGYHEVQDLVSGTFTLEKIDEQEKAHEAWLQEKEQVLNGLKSLIEFEDFQEKMLGDKYVDTGEKEILNRAVNFIKEQCHD